jgi:hypothetical protein
MILFSLDAGMRWSGSFSRSSYTCILSIISASMFLVAMRSIRRKELVPINQHLGHILAHYGNAAIAAYFQPGQFFQQVLHHGIRAYFKGFGVKLYGIFFNYNGQALAFYQAPRSVLLYLI